MELDEDQQATVILPASLASLKEFIESNRYSPSLILLQRLEFYANHCAPLSDEAYTLLFPLTRQITPYDVESLSHISQKQSTSIDTGSSWNDLQKSFSAQWEDLQQKLDLYRASQIQESVRVTMLLLIQLALQKGDTQTALRELIRARDVCTTPQQLMEVISLASFVGLVLRNESPQSWCISRLKALPASTPGLDSLTHRLQLLDGLHHLIRGRFKAAGEILLQTPFSLQSQILDVLSHRDLVTYAMLCSMATQWRLTLPQSFRSYLALCPDWQNLFRQLQLGQFSACWTWIQQQRPLWKLDLFLSRHLALLEKGIWQNLVELTVKPYSIMRLSELVKRVKADQETFENVQGRVLDWIELQPLIQVDLKEDLVFVKEAENEQLDAMSLLANLEPKLLQMKLALVEKPKSTEKSLPLSVE